MRKTIIYKSIRKFGLLFGLGFTTLIVWALLSISGKYLISWALCIGILGLILLITLPKSFHYPYKWLRTLIDFLGWLNIHIVLSLTFIFFIQPTSYLMRLFGYDPLRRRRKREKSYRENRKDHVTDWNNLF